ncbi:MAG: DUF1330 domain-containing protein [Alphaproteobacteria bacterium]
MPAGYIIAEVDVKNPKEYEAYRAQVPATVKQYGGEFIVRGGTVEGLEGAPPKGRIVIIKFPSFAQAKAWHDSAEYAGPKALRQQHSEGRLVVVEGA